MNIVNVAISQIGSSEKDLNQIEYNKWYYNRDVWGGSYPYCAVFVSWCAYKAGLGEDIIPKTASVRNMKEFFIKNKRFHTIASGYRPTLGDLMIQQYNGANHVGIVVDVDPLGFTTVEGNSGEGVQQCRHGFNEPEIVGFAVPNYPDQIDFHLQSFAGEGVKLTENEIWNWFKNRGYTDNVVAAVVAKIKQGNTRFNNSWHEVSPASASFGVFNWKWDSVILHVQSDNTPSQEDIQKYKREIPTSTLSKYFNHCESSGVSPESTAEQLKYFVENQERDFWLARLSNNNTSLEQSCKEIGDMLGNSTSNDLSIAQQLLSSYGGKTAEEVSNTPPDKATETDMQQRNANSTEIIGVYKDWVTVTVKEGDTLDSLAAEYDTTPQLILWGNNLNTWDIKPGDVLKVPKPSLVLKKTEIVAKYDTSLRTLAHRSTVQVTNPTAYVLFYGEYGRLAATSATSKKDVDEYMDYDLISLSTSRGIGQDNPTFSLSLVWRNKWYDNLASNDLVIIQLQRPGEQLRTVFFGLIDDIRKSMDFSSIQPQRSVVVTGRGFSKAFCQFDITDMVNYTNKLGGFNNGGFFIDILGLQGQSSSYIIQLIIETYLDKGMRYKFADGKTLKDYLGYLGTNFGNEKLINVKSESSLSGNVWNFIKEMTNEPFNETFWEIKNGCPYIIHRPVPFEPEHWIVLPCIVVPDCEIIADNTGRSDRETYTAFQVDLIHDGSSTKNAYPPVYYPPLYEKYGMRMLSVSTKFSVTESSVTKDVANIPTIFIKKLANFNIKNNIMENGTITVKGSNAYRIGERIILESSNMEYYVEGVSHNFNMYGTWTTSLQVTRGIKASERFTPPWGACIDLSNDMWEYILGQTLYGINPDWSKAKGGYSSNAMPTSTAKGNITGISIPGAGSGLENLQKANLQFRETPENRTSTTEIIFHHPYMFGSVEDVHNEHLKRRDEKGNPWIGIGYNLYIRQDGSLWEGRGVDTVGAHTFKYNTTSIGISVEGKFDSGVAPTQAQIDTASKVVAELAVIYNLEINRQVVTGHCEHPDQDTSSEKCTCPGSLLTEGYLDKIVENAKALKPKAVVKKDTPTSTNEVVKGQKVYNQFGLQWVWPAPGCDLITSYVGNRNHPISGGVKHHNGLDIVKSSGETLGSNIIAACSGKVIYAGRNGGADKGYGNLIEILHSSGYSTRYGHMYDEGVLVSVGETVEIGQIIGRIGSFGGSTGPHLHFEVRTGVGESMEQQGTVIDPLEIFTDKG